MKGCNARNENTLGENVDKDCNAVKVTTVDDINCGRVISRFQLEWSSSFSTEGKVVVELMVELVVLYCE